MTEDCANFFYVSWVSMLWGFVPSCNYVPSSLEIEICNARMIIVNDFSKSFSRVSRVKKKRKENRTSKLISCFLIFRMESNAIEASY